MHAYFITRGIKQDVDEFVKWLETRSLRLPLKDKDGKESVIPLQASLRPVQLWEFVFPENEKDAVLTTLKFHEKPPADSISMKLKIAALRKMLGAEKIPEFKTDNRMLMPDFPWVAITALGVRYDEKDWLDPASGNYHERL